MKKEQHRTRQKGRELENRKVLYTRMRGTIVDKLTRIAKRQGLCRSTLLTKIVTEFVKTA